VPLPGGRKLGPIKHNVAWAKIYLRIKWHLDTSSHVATIDMGRKVGDAVPLSRGAESPFNTMSPGPMPTSVPNGMFIHPAVGHNRHGPKIWGCVPLGGTGSPSNIMSPGPTSTSLSNGILIYPAVWPQQTRAENWDVVCPFLRGSWSSSKTMWPGRGLPPC